MGVFEVAVDPNYNMWWSSLRLYCFNRKLTVPHWHVLLGIYFGSYQEQRDKQVPFLS
jgi:hypothetical protein